MFRQFHSPAPECQAETRTGTATVELAIVIPVVMTLMLGIAEMSRGLDVSERLSSAVRQGARAAAAARDFTNQVPAGWTLNQKVTKDIQNMLTASGLNGSKVVVSITYADGAKAGQPFDLSKKENDLQYFKVTATVPYSDVGLFPSMLKNKSLVSSVVFRLGESSLTN